MALPPRPYTAAEDPAPESTPPPSDHVASPHPVRTERTELRELPASDATSLPSDEVELLRPLRTELRELRASVTRLDKASRDASVETTLKEVLAKLHLLELRLEHSAETLRFASWTALACLVVAALLAVLT